MDKYQKALKERVDNGDKSAEEILINSYVQSLLEPVVPMLAMRVKTIMEEVFDQTRKKYEPTIRTDNSAVIAELERQIHTMSIACRQDAIKLDALREENERLRKALREIRDSEFLRKHEQREL